MNQNLRLYFSELISMWRTYCLSLILLLLGSLGCSPFRAPAGRDEPYAPAVGSRDYVGPEVDDSSFWDAFNPDKISENARRLTGRSANETIARASYEAADVSFRSGTSESSEEGSDQLADAAEWFEGAADRWPDSALEEDALFMVGESHFFADRYSEAAEAYEELIGKYSRTRHLDIVDARRFAIAQYWLQLHERNPHWSITPNFTDGQRPRFDTFGNAVRLLEKIRLDDPTGDLADDATMALANAHFQREKYASAEEFYSDLRQTYTNSSHQFEAHLLGLRCKMQNYQGPDYDGADLENAENLIVQMRRLFPDQARNEQEFLDRAFREIRLKRAEREWAFATYYDRRHQYTAAQMYYEQLAADYSDTNLAEQAQKRLADLRGRPSESEKDFAWLPQWLQDGDEEPRVATGPREAPQ